MHRHKNECCCVSPRRLVSRPSATLESWFNTVDSVPNMKSAPQEKMGGHPVDIRSTTPINVQCVSVFLHFVRKARQVECLPNMPENTALSPPFFDRRQISKFHIVCPVYIYEV